jgi:hypothetical protein
MARKEKSQTAKTMAALKDAEVKKAPKPIFTPTQVIEQITDKMSKENATLTKSELTGALMDFADEANSRISIGMHFLKLQVPLGSDFTTTLQKFADAVNRSMSALWSYIGLARAFSFEFQRNPVARQQLSLVWDAKGCFDPANGELKPVVAEVLKDLPIPESKDGAECAVWARRFANEINERVKVARKANTGKTWTAEVVAQKHGSLVKAAVAFNKVCSGRLVSKMLAAMFVAMATTEGKNPSVVIGIIAEALKDTQAQLLELGLEKRKLAVEVDSEQSARKAS